MGSDFEDEEIEEDEAFDSEDEAMFDHMFAKGKKGGKGDVGKGGGGKGSTGAETEVRGAWMGRGDRG